MYMSAKVTEGFFKSPELWVVKHIELCISFLMALHITKCPLMSRDVGTVVLLQASWIKLAGEENRPIESCY